MSEARRARRRFNVRATWCAVAAIVTALAVAPASAAASPRTDVLRPPGPAPVVTGLSPSLASSRGGTVLTVLGQHFRYADGVLFGDRPARTFRVLSDGAIRVTVPDGVVGAIADVRIESPAGPSRLSTKDRLSWIRTSDRPAWGAATLIDPRRSGAAQLSCPTTSFCGYAKSNSVYTSTDGQDSPTTPIPAGFRLTSISCPATGVCHVVGAHDGQYLAGSLRDGRWSFTIVASAGQTGEWRLSCPSVTECWAVSGGYARIRLHGSTWRMESSRDLVGSYISCPSDQFCVTAGDHELHVKRAGVWSVVAVDVGVASEVECRSVSFCMVDGEDGIAMWNGLRWTVSLSKSPFRVGFGHVMCLSAERCADVTLSSLGPEHYEWEWDGRSWAANDHPVQYWPATHSCPSLNFCLMNVSDGFASWDGTTWSPIRRKEHSQGGPGPVHCPTVTMCGVLDGRGNVLFLRDGAWSAPAFPLDDPDAHSRAFDCGGPSFCLTEDAVWNGSSWSSLVSPTGPYKYRIRSITCTSPRFCLGVTEDRYYSAVFDGVAWGSFSSMDSAMAVSCPADGVCFAVDYYSKLSRFSSGKWTAVGTVPQTPDHVTPYPSGLSCPTASLCFVVVHAADDQHGVIFSYGWVRSGGRWISIPIPAATDVIRCRTDTDCAAVTDSGIWHFDGASWIPSLAGVPSTTLTLSTTPTGYVVTSSDGSVRFSH